jgi:hypothetical protein
MHMKLLAAVKFARGPKDFLFVSKPFFGLCDTLTVELTHWLSSHPSIVVNAPERVLLEGW